jgi:hypothetical protein
MLLLGRPMADTVTRRALLRWLGWFAAANALVLCLASLRYLGSVPTTPLSWVYLGSAYISYLALLAAAPLFVILVPLVVLTPNRRLVLAVGVALMALLVAGLTLDSLVWTQSRFHLNLLTIRILEAPSWIFSMVMFLIALIFESLLARAVWRWVSASHARRGWLAGGMISLTFLLAQAIHAWADASYHTPVTAAAVNLPAYRGITAKGLLDRTGLVKVRFSRERRMAQRLSGNTNLARSSSLSYPLEPLRCHVDERLNLLLIVIDALRGDSVSLAVTPNIHALAEERAIVFTQHFSGGNSSRIGFFSLFYGLPPGYFASIQSLQQAPVLLTELQKQDYQLGIFSSSSLVRPAALDRTAFATVPDQQITVPDISTPYSERVRIINAKWLQWIDRIGSKRPFFGFLYYDSSRVPSPGGAVPKDASPEEREFADYQTAMRANDQLVGLVLDDLQERGLMDRTVVLITSDHGEQFGEHGGGLIGHGSSYSRAQLHVPLVLHWPGMAAGKVDKRTSHYDVAPTLMARLLGCANPAQDYSSGADLLNRQSWDWLLAGSYYNYAVLEPDQITITFPNGTYEVRDWNYAILENPQFRSEVLQAVIRENSRFHP